MDKGSTSLRRVRRASCGLLLAFGLWAGQGARAAEPEPSPAPAEAGGRSNPAPFFERYFETYNSDYQYFFIRKQMRLNELTASISVNQLETDAWETQSKVFLPIYYGESFSFVFPIYFYRFPLAAAQRKELPFDAVQNCFWQAIFDLRLGDDLRLAFITESRHVGTPDSQFNRVGSDLGQFVLLQWRISDQFTFAPAVRGQVRWDSEGDPRYALTPAGHLVWRPTPSLSLSTGVPSLFSFEWAAPGSVDVAAHVMLGEGDIDLMAAVRKRFSRQLALTLRGLRDGYRDVFVPAFTVAVEGRAAAANRVGQYKDRVQVELEFSPSARTTVQAKAGYAFDEGVEIKREDALVRKLAGVHGFLAGVTLITHLDLDQ